MNRESKSALKIAFGAIVLTALIFGVIRLSGGSGLNTHRHGDGAAHTH